MRKLIVLLLLILLTPLYSNAVLYPRMGAKLDLNDPSTRDLIAWYPIGQGDGDFITNVPSSAGPGLMEGVGYTATSGLVLEPERGWVFAADGTDDYINTQWAGGLDGRAFHQSMSGGRIFLRGFTVSCWMKPDDGQPGASNTLWGTIETGGLNQCLGVLATDGSMNFIYQIGGGLAYAKTPAGVFANGQESWYHIVCTVNYGVDGPGAMEIWHNGVKQALTVGEPGDTSGLAVPWLYPSTAKTVWLGRRDRLHIVSGYPFKGLLDDFRFYKRYLTAWEIKKLYNDSYQTYPVRRDPVQLLQSMAKTNVLLDDWVNFGDDEVVGTGEINASSTLSLAGSVGMAVYDVATEMHDGTRVIVQVSSADTGNENWSDLVEFYMPVTQEPNELINDEDFLNNEGVGDTVFEIGDTGGNFDDDGARWIAAIDVGTIADTEMSFQYDYTTNTDITVLDGLTNAKDNTNDFLSDIAETRTISIPAMYKRIRFIYDGTTDEDFDGPSVIFRTRYSGQAEAVTSGQVIRLVH